MDRNECRLCTEDELKEKGISYEQEEWELKAVLSVTQENGRNLRRPDLSLMFMGDWLSPFAHKSLQAWNANKRMRLRLGCPHQNDIYLFTNVNTLRLLTNWRYPFSFTVGDWTHKLYTFTNLNGLVWKWLHTINTHCPFCMNSAFLFIIF